MKLWIVEASSKSRNYKDWIPVLNFRGVGCPGHIPGAYMTKAFAKKAAREMQESALCNTSSGEQIVKYRVRKYARLG